MTVVSVASFIQANSHPAHGDRRWLEALAGRGGVIPKTATFTDLKVSQRGAGANMSVDVAAGQCYVTGTESSTQGVYHCDNVGVENKTITASNPTNPRRDLIVARIKDVEYSGAANEFLLDVIAGTPAGSPADPTVPANCIVLARVAVAANATSITNANITDLRNNYTAVTGSSVIGNQQKALAHGGVIPCLSTSRPTIAIYEGMHIYETDTQVLRVYNGTTWLPTTAAGRAYATSGSVINGTISLNTDTQDFLKGGMTFASNGLVVPIAGIYQCNGMVKVQPPSAGVTFTAALMINGTLARYGMQHLTQASYEVRVVNDLMSLSAGERVNVGYSWSGTTTALQIDATGLSNYVSVALVSF